MTTSPRRPILIWISLIYIAVSAVLQLLVLVRNYEYLLNSGYENVVVFLFAISMVVFQILTFDAIIRRLNWGQRLAILYFSLLGVFAIYNAITIFNWPETGHSANNLLPAKILVLGRICISFYLAIAFGVSESVDKYFAHGKEPVKMEPANATEND